MIKYNACMLVDKFGFTLVDDYPPKRRDMGMNPYNNDPFKKSDVICGLRDMFKKMKQDAKKKTPL